ncbi:hypothetical protein QO058_30180 (plasmid) [Bosea vestrisii]|uniref:hypothetical protein n=1 Tax=Bosea vestrisii TaxID=151416 RepID=UPI0024E036EF|nr:hypothetical protein [Bosea vestrisii]WID99671.1 hypothetical protein QO058_30180 [Bosea vestrisii]
MRFGQQRSAGHLCLSVSSRDGLYSAENLYRVPDRGVLKAPFQYESRYRDRLAVSPKSSFGVLIRAIDDCESPRVGAILPALDEDATRLEALQFALNAPVERIVVKVADSDGKDLGKATCRGDATLTSTAFSSICTLPLPPGPLSGKYALEVAVRETFSSAVSAYELLLDRP